MNPTKQKILEVALELFSQQGFEAVSIRDICKRVQIKESSIYYHFQNKQAILDALLVQFEAVAMGLMARLEQALESGDAGQSFAEGCQTVCDRFFEQYLMDDFCNQMMRLLLIEQGHSAQLRAVCGRWLFDEPLRFQATVFSRLMAVGLLPQADSGYLAVQYYAPIFLFAQRWLFSGPLCEEHKAAFRTQAAWHVRHFFAQAGGAA